MSREEQVEAALIAHEPLTDYDGEIDVCRCGEWHGPDTWQQHVADSPAFRAVLADERAAALREAADVADRDAESCPYGCQSVQCRNHNLTTARWLRARADEVTR